jgi:hypothetical protein
MPFLLGQSEIDETFDKKPAADLSPHNDFLPVLEKNFWAVPQALIGPNISLRKKALYFSRAPLRKSAV